MNGCTHIVFVSLVTTGVMAATLGGLGFLSPCNRYANARVTWCGPGIELGWGVFNITYDAYSGSFESKTPCTPSSALQMLRVCYPLRDPRAFEAPPDDLVMFTDPRTALALVIGGAVAIAVGIVVAVLADRHDRMERTQGISKVVWTAA